MGVLPEVSVIIAVKDEKDTIRRTLEALDRQTFPKDHFEVVIVDGGSTDGTLELVRSFSGRMRVHLSSGIPRSGPSDARNAGIGLAKGEIIAFTDADCIPADNWLENLIRDFKNPKVGGSAGELRFVDLGNHLSRLEDLFAIDTYHGFITSNIAYRKEVLQKAKGFDLSLKCAEDFDLYLRVLDMGYEMTFNPTATIYHDPPENHSWWAFAKKQFWFAKMDTWFHNKRISTIFKQSGEKVAVKESLDIIGNSVNVAATMLFLALSPIFPLLLIPGVALFFYLSAPRMWNMWKLRHEIRYPNSGGLYAVMPAYLLLRIFSRGLGTTVGWMLVLASGIKARVARHTGASDRAIIERISSKPTDA